MRDGDGTGLSSPCTRMHCNVSGEMDVAALRVAIAADRDRDLSPFLVVATAGSVDTGAIDDLAQIANVCEEQHLWFHVDAAFGAIAMLSPTLRPLLAGMERADSLVLDPHKWLFLPYDIGCLFVRRPGALAAAYNPTTNSWRRIASLPQRLNGQSATWDGRELLVVGSRGLVRVVCVMRDAGRTPQQAFDFIMERWNAACARPESPPISRRGRRGLAETKCSLARPVASEQERREPRVEGSLRATVDRG